MAINECQKPQILVLILIQNSKSAFFTKSILGKRCPKCIYYYDFYCESFKQQLGI